MTALVDKKAERGGPGPKGAEAQKGHASKRSPGVISHPNLKIIH